MSWSEQFQRLKKQSEGPARSKPGSASVESLSEIPLEATPLDVFRLQVEVIRVDKRETRLGDPCYFLHVRDAQGVRFSIICWHLQWTKLQGKVEAGEKATLDVKVPVDGFDSFTLALK